MLVKRIILVMICILFSCVNCADSKADMPDGLYAEMNTDKGKIIIQLEMEKTPMTVANFVGLAEGTIKFENRSGKKYYDGLVFHRVIKDFMIQGGCPSGDGRGDPGYKFPDEFHPDLKHTDPGILSMANSGPNTNGSQFFITHKETPWLDGKHTVFGHVIEGQDIVDSIAQGDKLNNVTIIRVGELAENFKSDQAAFDSFISGHKERLEEQQRSLQAADLNIIAEKWPNAKTTDSGLKYVVLNNGSGGSPAFGNEVTVNYKGMLLDGTVFDATPDGQPATFRIGQVIQGWNEALVTMKKGEKRLLIIPPNLGYGEQGHPGVIPPNAFLVFEVELLGYKE